MMKYKGYPNFDPFRRYFDKYYWERPSAKLFMTWGIKQLKLVLAQIVTAWQKSFPKSHFSSFAINQYGNSWKLRWVNSTILSNKIWLILISYTVFMSTLPAVAYEYYFLISWKLMVVKILTVSLVACEQCTEQLIYWWQTRNCSFAFLCC